MPHVAGTSSDASNQERKERNRDSAKRCRARRKAEQEASRLELWHTRKENIELKKENQHLVLQIKMLREKKIKMYDDVAESTEMTRLSAKSSYRMPPAG